MCERDVTMCMLCGVCMLCGLCLWCVCVYMWYVCVVCGVYVFLETNIDKDTTYHGRGMGNRK